MIKAGLCFQILVWNLNVLMQEVVHLFSLQELALWRQCLHPLWNTWLLSWTQVTGMFASYSFCGQLGSFVEDATWMHVCFYRIPVISKPIGFSIIWWVQIQFYLCQLSLGHGAETIPQRVRLWAAKPPVPSHHCPSSDWCFNRSERWEFL